MKEDQQVLEEKMTLIIGLQKKLVKIVRAEQRLSKLEPLNQSRLTKQRESRLSTMNAIHDTLNELFSMGVSFKMRRRKKIIDEST